MLTDILHIAIQTILVLVLLSAMVLLLLSINKMFRAEPDNTIRDTRMLKHEVEEDENVISRHSVFHGFLARDANPAAKRVGSK
ncbi:MAG: hypothetical protein HDS13_03355 [Bacteroides sp.]|nr:hypothetical protein [Bacteroides sp.]